MDSDLSFTRRATVTRATVGPVQGVFVPKEQIYGDVSGGSVNDINVPTILSLKIGNRQRDAHLQPMETLEKQQQICDIFPLCAFSSDALWLKLHFHIIL